MKHIEITFPNGETWRIDAGVVAEDRADRFYAGRGFEEAVEYALSNDEELVDYLRYVMGWIEIKQHVRHTGLQATYDYAEAFDDATFTVKGE